MLLNLITDSTQQLHKTFTAEMLQLKKKKHQQQHIEPSGEPSNDTAKEY